MQHMTPQQLHHYLANATVPPLLLDVREPWEYQIGHLDGATLIPMRQIPQQAAVLDRNAEIVVICHHGVRSFQVAAYLERLGFMRTVNLTGGMDAWAKQVDPSVPTY
jgi:rhodanese-related sulfurtransferase